jgi:hypothetical protein
VGPEGAGGGQNNFWPKRYNFSEKWNLYRQMNIFKWSYVGKKS